MASHASTAVLCALLFLLLGGTKAVEPDSDAIESMLEDADKMALGDATVLFAGTVSSVYYNEYLAPPSRLLATKWILLRVPCATGVKHYIFARSEVPRVVITASYATSYHYNFQMRFSLTGTSWMETKHHNHMCSYNAASCNHPFVGTFYKEIPAYIDVAQLSKEDIVVEQLDSAGNPLRPADSSIDKTEIASDSTGSRFTGQQNEIMHVDSQPTALLMTRWIIFRMTSITGIKHYLFTRTEGIVIYVNETAPTVIPEFTIAVKGHGPIWMASARHDLCSHTDLTNDDCSGKEFIKEFETEIPGYVDMSMIGKDDIIINHIYKENTWCYTCECC